ncbi:MAG: glycerate kinase [Ignavibacteria bacterium]|nr:glycerate kinase [Ignavibacteria bacterium]
MTNKKKIKILLAVNSFKESLDSVQINQILSNHLTDFESVVAPISDGGDGFLEVVDFYNSLERKIYIVPAPRINRKIRTQIRFDTNNIFIESAKVLGLSLLRKDERNPRFTSSLGLGILLKKILSDKTFYKKKLVIGIGGTSTNDAGIGMASVFGYKFIDKNGIELQPIGDNLIRINSIELPDKIFERKSIILALSDVVNPIVGELGSTKVYAKQKGASKKDIELLEEGMLNFCEVIRKVFGMNIQNESMYGAGGGLAAGLSLFLNAKVMLGSKYFLRNKLFNKKYNFIIIGEGKLDNQSFYGKAVGELYKLAQDFNSKLIIICGIHDKNFLFENTHPQIEAIFELSKYHPTVSESLKKIKQSLKTVAAEITNYIKINYFNS